MEDRVLEAVGEGTRGFSDLADHLDAGVGELFLACRQLDREGCLERTGPLVFRLTEEGRRRIEGDPDR